MFCSTIIPTIGRPTLARTVCSVLDQEFDDDFEVIVVNDSGKPLLDEEWQKSPRVQVIHTNQHNRSVARNAGAAIAKGQYLHFLDDDDWMLPGAFQSLRQLAETSSAAWVYGAFRFVDNASKTVAEIFPGEEGNCHIQMLFWEWLPLQASFIESKAFFVVGGFASLQSLLGGFEDIDLSRQISHYYDMVFVPEIVTCVRVGDVGSTTNYVTMFQQNRQSREKTIQMPGAFSRLKASARDSQPDAHYWHGRIVYAYLASMKWNLKQKRLLTAVSRAACTLAALILPIQNLFSSNFWRGVLKPHIPRQGIALSEYGAELYADTKQKLTW
jgi:glycosyltransferase involved in cell wall biosynthesis